MTQPCLILLPGLLNDDELWRDQVHVLSPQYDVRVADITRADTIPGLAKQVLETAPGRFSLAGFSLGGFVAQEILRQAPERVERLALLDTAYRPDSAERRAERLATSRAAEMAATSSGRFLGMSERMLRAYLGPLHSGNVALRERVRTMTQRVGLEVFLRQNALERPDGEGVLSGFRKPALLLCGEHDRVTPPDVHREMAELMPQAELVIAPGCGHLTPMEAPYLVSTTLAAWMRRR